MSFISNDLLANGTSVISFFFFFLVAAQCSYSQNLVTDFPFHDESSYPDGSNYIPFDDGFPKTHLKPLKLVPLVKTRLGEPSLYILAPNITASKSYFAMSEARTSGLSLGLNLDVESPFAATSDSQNVQNILDARGNINLEFAAKGGLFGGLSQDKTSASQGITVGFSGSFAIQSSSDTAANSTFTNSFLVGNIAVNGWLEIIFVGIKLELYSVLGKEEEFEKLFEETVKDGVVSALVAIPLGDFFLQGSYVYPISYNDFEDGRLEFGIGASLTPF